MAPALSLARRREHNTSEQHVANAPHRRRTIWEACMSEKIYPVSAEWKKRGFVDEAKYQEMYARSIKDPDAFWAAEAKRIHWYKAPTRIKNASFAPDNVSIKW